MLSVTSGFEACDALAKAGAAFGTELVKMLSAATADPSEVFDVLRAMAWPLLQHAPTLA
jgi:hypothetical protein